ncbi:RNA polymerase sporulation sigma factor SigF [Heliophilum fasciatum]|uniref:RNA polymerase sigma factor n=1 Tax=Heliophilum fasciatum TaxID=35700 RepID=A0A4R2RSG3_9FIRM|nr:RNA polymerase sporulation sigma factor SigF [Heliophilum fasciatum]MCW2277366.1 RNA polymerase sporulation-specific sigma factor [Heliophilum fasciatum]TCP67202.1 RNA polymerase sigma (RpoX/SigF) subunit [Heliophilum fasciatum]
MTQRLTEMNLPRFPLLGEAEMTQLLMQAREGDEQARERLIQCNLRLVFTLVQRFQHRGYELEDLFQIGVIGLIKAIDKFDPTFQVRFSTYAVPMIIGEIRRFLRDDSPVKVSRSYKELAQRIYRAQQELAGTLGRDPSVTEIAEHLVLPVENVVEALEAVQAPTSIHETLYQDEGDPIFLLDQLRSTGSEEHVWFEQLALKDVLSRVAPREREILNLRFFQDKTQMEVAEQIGLSQVQISRIERAALRKIRGMLYQDEGSKKESAEEE